MPARPCYEHLIHDQFDQTINLVNERLKRAKTLKRTSRDPDQCEIISEEIRLCKMLVELLNHFENYWINEITHAMFCVQGHQHSTNNFAEGMNVFRKVSIRELIMYLFVSQQI